MLFICSSVHVSILILLLDFFNRRLGLDLQHQQRASGLSLNDQHLLAEHKP